MPRELNADNAYDTLALLIRARDMHEQAIREAMDLLIFLVGTQLADIIIQVRNISDFFNQQKFIGKIKF